MQPFKACDVDVALGERAYRVRIGRDTKNELAAFLNACLDATWAGRACKSVLIVLDVNVISYREAVIGAVRSTGRTARTTIVPAGETTKSIAQAVALWDELIAMRADRHTLIVALGGGVVGDVAGFAAATFARGLPLFMIPTTLLAQVDSAVGGKVGINHPRAKNSIGAFHQPVGVWIDLDMLATLPNRELRCGLAEVVKYGVILDAQFFAFLEANAERILARELALLQQIVEHSCRLKAAVVSEDERETTGARAALNFGHTIGHAVEAIAGYDGAFQHGEAVAVGMVAECRLAETLGWIGPEIGDRVATLLRRLGLPDRSPGLDAEALLLAMSHDKKNRAGQVRFVLPRTLGRVELTDAATTEMIREALRVIL